MDDSFGSDPIINWRNILSPAHDAAGAEEGRSSKSGKSGKPLPSSFSPIGWPMTPEPFESASLGDAQPIAEAVPGNEDTNQVTAIHISSQGDVDTLGSGQALSSTSPSPSQKCACVVCLGISTSSDGRGPYNCRFASCKWINTYSPDYKRWANLDRAAHEKTHYQQDPNNSHTPFRCPIENCRFSSKRWLDLRRHTSATHCENPPRFACPVIGCKYNGEGNGFTRKDKLTAHYKSMHQGQKVPGQAVRAIKPAPASSHAEASGSSSMTAQGE